VAGPSLLPEFRAPVVARLDLVSAAMSMAAILAIVYGLKEVARDGWQTVPAILLLAGVVLAFWFVDRQRTLAEPLVDPSLFRNRVFSSALTIMLVGGIFLGGSTLLVTQYLQLVEGLSPLAAGLWLLPSIAAMVVGTMSGPILAKRMRPAMVIAIGLTTAAVGFAGLTLVDSTDPLALIVIAWAIALGGNGLPAGIIVGLIIGSAPPEKAGSASAIQQTATEFGLAMGIAVLGSLAGAAYRIQIAGSIPAGTPDAAADAARDSINSAVQAAQQFPAILEPARAASASGLNVAAAVSAVVMAALAVLALAALRHVGGPGSAPPDEGAALAQDQSATAPAGR
jgi:DHA2 family multidrug resistance protein-like MFS transporter